MQSSELEVKERSWIRGDLRSIGCSPFALPNDFPYVMATGSLEHIDLDYSVDVLTKPEPVDDVSQLDPRKYGVIVEAGWRRGLLLPDLQGVDRAEYQIDICRQKGGIEPDEPVQLYRFEVKRYK